MKAKSLFENKKPTANAVGCVRWLPGTEYLIEQKTEVVQRLSTFFGVTIVSFLSVDILLTSKATYESPCSALDKAPIAHCLTNVFMPQKIL